MHNTQPRYSMHKIQISLYAQRNQTLFVHNTQIFLYAQMHYHSGYAQKDIPCMHNTQPRYSMHKIQVSFYALRTRTLFMDNRQTYSYAQTHYHSGYAQKEKLLFFYNTQPRYSMHKIQISFYAQSNRTLFVHYRQIFLYAQMHYHSGYAQKEIFLLCTIHMHAILCTKYKLPSMHNTHGCFLRTIGKLSLMHKHITIVAMHKRKNYFYA